MSSYLCNYETRCDRSDMHVYFQICKPMYDPGKNYVFSKYLRLRIAMFIVTSFNYSAIFFYCNSLVIIVILTFKIYPGKINTSLI